MHVKFHIIYGTLFWKMPWHIFFQLDKIPTLKCFSYTAVISITYDYDFSCFLGT